LEENSTLEVLM